MNTFDFPLYVDEIKISTNNLIEELKQYTLYIKLQSHYLYLFSALDNPKVESLIFEGAKRVDVYDTHFDRSRMSFFKVDAPNAGTQYSASIIKVVPKKKMELDKSDWVGFIKLERAARKQVAGTSLRANPPEFCANKNYVITRENRQKMINFFIGQKWGNMRCQYMERDILFKSGDNNKTHVKKVL